MNLFIKRIIIIIIAVLLGIIGTNYLFAESWLNLIPWGIIALIIGYNSSNRKDAIINGAIFGYVVFVSFILSGYKGETDYKSIVRIILFSLLFSLIGAAYGIIGSFAGNFLKKKILKR